MFEMFKKLMYELQFVPGLGFLGRYHAELMAKQDDFEERIEMLNGQVDGYQRGVDAVKNAPKSVKGSKRSS